MPFSWPSATEILPHLYVGSEFDAQDLRFLRQQGFTHILNVADDVPNYFEEHFVYCHLPVADYGQDAGISRVFDEARAFVQTALAPAPEQSTDSTTDTRRSAHADSRAPSPKILLHCAHGCNRSVTVCVALLMMLHGMRLRRAIQQVTSRRTVAWIEQDNRLQLMAFEKSLFQGASTVSESDFRGDTTWLDRVSSTDSDDE